MAHAKDAAFKSRPRGWRMLLDSTIGKKIVMGVTGLVMVGWLFLHMVGNTLLYAGATQMDFYGWVLQEGSHGAIWISRVVTLVAIVLHVWAALSLTRINAAARPSRYAKALQVQATNYAALTMRYGGIVLLLFVVYHLLHLTIGVVHPDFRHGAPYHNVVTGLSNPIVAAVYMVANLALGVHLFHGISSGLQTLGLNHPQYNGARKALGILVAVVIAGGNLSFPIAVLAGVVK